MKSNRVRHLWAAVTGILCLPGWIFAQQGLSHVRVVRLSYVSGTVAVKRPGSSDWAKALVNTPIQEGFSVSTSSGSFAEVEFENGSTARLGELSQIDFSQLALAPEGNKLNRFTFEQGYATFHIEPERGDVYSVLVADASVTPEGRSEFRTDFAEGRLRVEVFNGSVEVKTPSQSAKLSKDKVLEYNSRTQVAFDIQHGIQPDDWDHWTKARDTQAQLALNDQAVQLNHSMYGWDDLNTYGEWASIPGYGYGWSPYEPAGWSPYSMGMWDFYPSFGWTWIGAEPWGWTPYHYGMWNYADSFGWFWMPGGDPFWSPALVNWYGGPGWYGWSPYGYGGGAIAAVSGGAIQNGRMITPGSVIHVRGQGTRLGQLPLLPSARTMLSGTPLDRNVMLPGRMVNAPRLAAASAPGRSVSPASAVRDPLASNRTGSAPALRGPASRAPISRATLSNHSAAPPTVLMGSNPEAEKALLNEPRSAWGRFWNGSPSQPLRVQSGTTLGGHFPVLGASRQIDSGTPQVVRGERSYVGGAPAARSGAFSGGTARFARGGGMYAGGRGMGGMGGGGAAILAHGSMSRGGGGGFSGAASRGGGGFSGGGYSGSGMGVGTAGHGASMGGHSSGGGSSSGGHR